MVEFKDRKKESAEINEILGSKRFEFFILYGRRRVGKTELILHSTKNKKRIYYLATGEKNLERFYNVCVEYDSEIKNLKQDYEILFKYLKDKVDVIIIDEFQNMIKEDKNIVNILQSSIDMTLKDSKLKLFLLGSSVSIISSKVLSYQSPLYGRRTASMKLKPVGFFELREFFPKLKFEEIIELYGFTDGIPYYLIKMDGDLWKWLSSEIKKERSFLRDEIDFIMRYEFEDTSTYKLILEAIANGKNKLGEIKDYVKLQRTDLSPYLKNLLDVDLIKREVPVTENIKSRNGRYFLNDNFVRFWFRFVYPNISSIESGIFDLNTVKKEYSQYLGKTFEEISLQYIIKQKIFNFNKIGRWWWKQEEIDIVALNQNEKKLLLGECKYSEKVDAERVVRKLIEKQENIDVDMNGVNIEYAVFAKSFSKKISEVDGKKVHCFDLGDLQKV